MFVTEKRTTPGYARSAKTFLNCICRSFTRSSVAAQDLFELEQHMWWKQVDEVRWYQRFTSVPFQIVIYNTGHALFIYPQDMFFSLFTLYVRWLSHQNNYSLHTYILFDVSSALKGSCDALRQQLFRDPFENRVSSHILHVTCTDRKRERHYLVSWLTD